MIPTLLKKARNGEARFFVQFGGQGNSFLREASVLYKNFPILKKYFSVCVQAVGDFLSREDVQKVKQSVYPVGFDVGSWLTTEQHPAAEELAPCQISFPGNQITQLATWHYFTENFAAAGCSTAELLKYCAGTTGHSQGLQAAVAISLGKEGDAFYETLYEFVYWFAAAGFFTQQMYAARPVSDTIKNLAYELDREAPTPMAVIIGMPQDELLSCIEKFNKTLEDSMGIDLSLVNTEQVLVVTGHIDDIVRFREFYFQLFAEKKYGWNYVGVSAPFHRREPFEVGIHDFYNDKASVDFAYTGADLKLPVYSFHDGQNMQETGRLSEIMARTMVMSHLDWRLALKPLETDNTITHVLDFGPGKISAMLTRGLFKEKNLKIMSAVGRAGMNTLLSAE